MGLHLCAVVDFTTFREHAQPVLETKFIILLYKIVDAQMVLLSLMEIVKFQQTLVAIKIIQLQIIQAQIIPIQTILILTPIILPLTIQIHRLVPLIQFLMDKAVCV